MSTCHLTVARDDEGLGGVSTQPCVKRAPSLSDACVLSVVQAHDDTLLDGLDLPLEFKWSPR